MLGGNGALHQGMAEEDLKAAEEDKEEAEQVPKGCPGLSPGRAALTAARRGMNPGNAEHLGRRGRTGRAGIVGKLGIWPRVAQTPRLSRP